MLGSSFTRHFVGNVQQVWKRKCLPSDPIEIGVTQGTLNHTAGSAWLQPAFTNGRSSGLEKTSQECELNEIVILYNLENLQCMMVWFQNLDYYHSNAGC